MIKNNTNYKIQDTNFIFKKLVKKICNQNTPLNNSFNWFNKYHVEMISGTRGFTCVYVTDILSHSKNITNFSIDFWTNTLTFHSISDGENFFDYNIEDSIIAEFIKVSPDYNPAKVVLDYPKSDDEEIYMEIVFNPKEFIEEAVKEADDAIKFLLERRKWIRNINIFN